VSSLETKIQELEDKLSSETDTNALDILEPYTSFVLIDSIENKASDVAFLIKLRTCKEEINPIVSIETVLNNIHATLSEKSTPTLRAWVYKVKNIHPNLAGSIIDNLNYYQPTSESVGACTLGYSQDTQNLDLEDWNGKLPKPLRVIIKNKINSETTNMIENAYHSLNSRLVQNISSEFSDERDRKPDKMLAVDYHIMGDTLYYEDHLKLQKDVIKTKIKNVLKDAIRLINYLYPVNTLAKIENDSFTITAEKKEMTINLKGNKIEVALTKIDNKILVPIDE